jgi:hypothetical protein
VTRAQAQELEAGGQSLQQGHPRAGSISGSGCCGYFVRGEEVASDRKAKWARAGW